MEAPKLQREEKATSTNTSDPGKLDSVYDKKEVDSRTGNRPSLGQATYALDDSRPEKAASNSGSDEKSAPVDENAKDEKKGGIGSFAAYRVGMIKGRKV
jgi:hypothetical protein